MTSEFTDTFVLSFLGWFRLKFANFVIHSFHIRQDNSFFIRSMLHNISKESGSIIPFRQNKKTIFSIGILSPYQWSTNKCTFQSFEGSHLEAFSKPFFISQTIKRKGYKLYAITACRIIPSFLLFKWEVIHGGSNRLIFLILAFWSFFFNHKVPWPIKYVWNPQLSKKKITCIHKSTTFFLK